MNPPTHEQIAERAHQLWLAEGCPEGRQDEHWRVAERALRSSSGTSPEAASNDKGRITAPTPDRVAIAAAESADENLMSPAPSADTAIKAALPADTKRSRALPEPNPQPPQTQARPNPSAPGKPSAPLVAGH